MSGIWYEVRKKIKSTSQKKKNPRIERKELQISSHLSWVLILILSCDLDKLCLLPGKKEKKRI